MPTHSARRRQHRDLRACYRDIFRRRMQRLGAARGPPNTSRSTTAFEKISSPPSISTTGSDWRVARRIGEGFRRKPAPSSPSCRDNSAATGGGAGVPLAESIPPIPWPRDGPRHGCHRRRWSEKRSGSSATKMVIFGSTYQAHLGLKGIRGGVRKDEPMPRCGILLSLKNSYSDYVKARVNLSVGVVSKASKRRAARGSSCQHRGPTWRISPKTAIAGYDSTQSCARAVRVALGERLFVPPHRGDRSRH